MRNLSAHCLVGLTLILLIAFAPQVEGADAGGSLSLVFSVTDGVWRLVSATNLPERLRAVQPDSARRYQVTLESDAGEIPYVGDLGNPERYFYDYLDDQDELTGGVVQRSHFTCNVHVPDLQQPYSLQIQTSDKNVLYQASRAQLLDAELAERDSYPIYAIDTLVYSGDPEDKIDLVILGDAYLLEDTTLFLTHCANHINYTFNRVPFSHYSERFNIYAITTISNERGADHPEYGLYKDTYYNSEYWGRLLTADMQIAWGVIQEHCPQGEQIWMLVYDANYGGSGGEREAISYYASTRVLAHEFGHSFGRLWDEYTYGGNGSVGSAPNCDDYNVNPKWQAWIDIGYPEVGAYVNCTYDNAFRPTYYSCMMQALMDVYCIVCTEQIINRIYEDAPLPFDMTLPEDITYIRPGEEQIFTIDYSNRHDYPLTIEWSVDGEIQAGWNDTTFSFTPVLPGQFIVSATLNDTTSLVMNLPDSVLAPSHVWTVNVANFVCGDADGNEIVNISDAVYLVGYIFGGGDAPDPLVAADASCDGIVNISDAVYLVGYIFGGGPTPCENCP
jgi:hypothetical protein